MTTTPTETRGETRGETRTMQMQDNIAGMSEMATAPVLIVNDVVDTFRRPEGMTVMLGLAGMAALGAIEWPVAVAVGVGMAVARGMRS